MSRIETITSSKNSKIKDLLALGEKSSLRRQRGLFVVEGKREVTRCLSCGFRPRTLFVCGEILGEEALTSLVEMAEKADSGVYIEQLTKDVYFKAAYRGSTEGVILVAEEKPLTLSSLSLPENPLVAVLESVEKPGNLGAVLRSADASGTDALIVCDSLADVWNPNVIRASIGAVFTVPVAVCTTEEAIAFLKEKKISILTAQLQDSSLYYDTPMTGPTALVMGTESTGLSEEWRKAADRHIRIPMLGDLDSLNVSVSAAVLLYEAVRQRMSEQRHTTNE